MAFSCAFGCRTWLHVAQHMMVLALSLALELFRQNVFSSLPRDALNRSSNSSRCVWAAAHRLGPRPVFDTQALSRSAIAHVSAGNGRRLERFIVLQTRRGIQPSL